RTVLADLDVTTLRAKVTVDYPLEGTLFPPDLCAPTFLWHDADNTVNAWLIDVAFEGHPKHVYAVTSGVRKRRDTDPRCTTNANVWTEPAYPASAKAWTPDERTWSIIKQRSVERKATVTVYGLVGTHGAALRPAQGLSTGTRSIVSRGGVTIVTSKDPVGAQVFYRDVPLMPSETKEGIIKPLKQSALPLIQWRLRDLSKREAPVVMEHLPTCANCHTFSADGSTLAMDMDGPDGDKGAHVVKTIAKRTVIGRDDVFSWNRLTEQASGKQSFGMFPQISPDGEYVVATVYEDVYVMNYLQYDFLQTFYPTRGVLAVYSRKTGTLGTLPGADDPQYVQSNATWSPDGTELVFIRAEAMDAYPGGPRAKFANDPNERQIRYDLYRIGFNGGRGGRPEPVEGASSNGMSNSFPRFSPDGKWIVFVGCTNGLLMRPDSKLYIIPASGGKARLMNCNTPRMNSWHSFSPNGRWLVFSSKWPTPYTQMYLTHIDAEGRDTPAILVPNSTAANRAVNLPEFAAIPPGGLEDITTPAVDYRRHLDRAEVLQKEGRLAEAMTEVRKSLELKSDYPDTYLACGFLLELEKKPLEALAQYREALEIDPRFFPAHNNMGAALMRMGRLPEALASFRAALGIYPRFVKALVNLGDALNRLDKPEEAVVPL
ncbi:MAG TPA: tetratricopeptide repeat protein, partial [Planctomycetota bacterium]|nr:tetratricopeptide repeat protein [Planctomycetota bacterium]